MTRARVGIVGGGFSGAMVAVHLARRAPGPLAISLFEPRPVLGAGVAYSAADPAHRVNVPASRMTVFTEEPGQFDAWCRASGVLQDDPQAVWTESCAFPQRAAFGRYIAGLVAEAGAARDDVEILHRQTRVTAIEPRRRGFRLAAEDGAVEDVDVLVLAVSHPPPAVPAPLRAAAAQGGRVVADPWAPGALAAIDPNDAVAIVGTGLTAADVLATLARSGHAAPILAFSRRGLMSRGHAFGEVPARSHFALAPTPGSARDLLRAVRREVARAAEAGVPWQAVFDDVRGSGQRLWQALPVAEQRRLVRHVRPFWDVHRFRVAPQLEAAIAGLRAAGRLTTEAASLVEARAEGGRVALTLRTRGAAHAEQRVVDVVVNTTGPGHRDVLRTNPALAALAAHGLLRLDAPGLGLAVDAHSRACGQDGTARPDLFISGPLARGRFGELMGLPQVSTHAVAVAAAVTALLQASWDDTVADRRQGRVPEGAIPRE